MRTVLLFLLTSLLSLSTLMAAKVEGTITQSDGKALPYASITIQNTNLGTSADEDGYFYIHLPDGKYTLKAQYLGYESQVKTIEVKGETVKVNFTLPTLSMSLGQVEIVAKDENPAYEIMRQAIKRKNERLQNIKSFESEVYLKGRLDILEAPRKFMGVDISDDFENMGLDEEGSGIVYALEQKSVFQEEGKQQHHYIEYVREAGNPQGLGFSQLPPVLDVYANRLDVLGVNERGFISPLHNQTFMYYDFEYLGEYLDDGQTVLAIKLIPKRSKEPVFKGTIYIFDGTYDMHSVELIADKTTEINLAEKLVITQMYRYISGQRVINRQNLHIEIEVLGFKAGGDFLSVYSKQQVNHTIDWTKTQKDKKIVASYNDTYNKLQSEEEWEELRPVRMNQKEVDYFEKQDSIYVEEHAKEDSISSRTSFGIMKLLAGGKIHQSKDWDLSFSGLLSTVNFNTVEGLNFNVDLTADIRLDSLNSMKVGTAHRYGFVNGHYNPNLFVSYKQQLKSNTLKNWSMSLAGGKEAFAINNLGYLPEIFNTFSSLVQGRNHLKLMEKDFATLGGAYSSGTGFSTSLSLSYQHYHQLHNRTQYSFVENPDLRYTSNQSPYLTGDFIPSSFYVDLGLSYQPGWTYVSFSNYLRPIRSNYPVFSLNYRKAIVGLFNTEANYDRIRFSVSQQVSLKLLGGLDYYAGFNSFLNNTKVPWAEWQHFKGNEYILHQNSANGFFMLPYYLMSNAEQWSAQAHVEWAWKGFLTNKIPGFKQLNWTGVVGGHAIFLPNNQYYELTFGLDNIGFKIYRFLRVDGVVSFENQQSPRWGVRVSASNLFKFVDVQL